MSYVKDFAKAVDSQNTPKLLELWEEYCSADELDVEEFVSILDAIEKSPFANFFGRYVDLSLPLTLSIKNFEERYRALAKIIDLQTTNTKELAELALAAVQEKYGSNVTENTLRKVGLQPAAQFQKALSSIDLLLHLKPGNCVFHQAGWGTAEVMEVSAVLERISLECEYAAGVKHLSFDNALKTLIPLPDEHFLSKRFAHPDQFEKQAKQDPLSVVKRLLKDLGDKTAAEIRDELCELVIPEAEWTKWWQAARAKIKKDTSIEYPATVRDPFRLRGKSLSHEDRFQKELHKLDDPLQFLLTSYQFVRDFPNMVKNEQIRDTLVQKLTHFFERKDTLAHQKLQILIFLEDLLNEKVKGFPTSQEFLSLFENLPGLIEKIDVLSFKKRAISLIREVKKSWPEIYQQLLSSSLPAPLKDYLLQILEKEEKDALLSYLQKLFFQPKMAPETFVWYFQKIYGKEQKELPFSDKKGLIQGLESFFLLLSQIEFDPEYKELAKKMHQLLAKNRFEMVRVIIEGTSIDFVREFLLISSKCHSLSDHDKKILRSLAQVVHPSLNSVKKIPDRERFDGSLLWTSEEGYIRSRERAERIATSEIVENAKEVEAARALGDLRENSEYKFAVEKRRHLQAELKRLGDLLNRARIITPLDVECEQVGIGNVVFIQSADGEEETLTILGPWDTDVERNIISFQSKLAQSICGKKVDDSLQFKEKEYQIKKIESIFSTGQ